MKTNQVILCECGCGKPVRVTGKKQSKYCRGHNPGVSTRWTEWDIANVINITNHDSYTTIKEEHEEPGEYILSHYPDPEKALLKKESYQSLSNEAKYVIELCLNAPAEILDTIISPVRGVISKHRIIRFCAKQWRNSRKTQAVFQELWEFVNNF